jgi:predicted DsbA family dithiol-disulfide isomerase
MGHDHSHKVQVLHATAPTCAWSWGYEAAFNRLRLVYGKQIDIRTMTLCVWDNFDEYMKEYGMKWPEFNPWLDDIEKTLGLPIARNLKRSQVPFNMFPATVAAHAALKQGEARGARFLRAVLRKNVVEAQDVSKDAALFDAAREAGLNLVKFRRDFAQTAARKKDYESQGHGWPELPLSYLAIAVTDGHRHVLLEHAFEPSVVEGAIDYLSGGRLHKKRPTDIAGYLREHGPAPTREVQRAFALKPAETARKLAALARAGKAKRVSLAGAVHWRAA